MFHSQGQAVPEAPGQFGHTFTENIVTTHAFDIFFVIAQNALGGAVEVNDSAGGIDREQSGIEMPEDVVGLQARLSESPRRIRESPVALLQPLRQIPGDKSHQVEYQDMKENRIEHLILNGQQSVQRGARKVGIVAHGQPQPHDKRERKGHHARHQQRAHQPVGHRGGDNRKQKESGIRRTDITRGVDDGGLDDYLQTILKPHRQSGQRPASPPIANRQHDGKCQRENGIDDEWDLHLGRVSQPQNHDHEQDHVGCQP